MEKLLVTTKQKREIVDITDDVQELIRELAVTEGLCQLFVAHTTAALTTADLDPGTDLDMLDAFEAMAPKLQYRHQHDPEHTPEHILAALIGPSVAVPFEDGLLRLGSWQRIVLIEFSGPRSRDVIASFILENA